MQQESVGYIDIIDLHSYLTLRASIVPFVTARGRDRRHHSIPEFSSTGCDVFVAMELRFLLNHVAYCTVAGSRFL